MRENIPVNVTILSSTVTDFCVGSGHTCVVTVSGAAQCWGSNFTGQLGNGTTTDSVTAVDVTGLSSGVAAISCGRYNTCALLDTGEMQCWGDNLYGQLGDGTTTDSSVPVTVSGLAPGVSAISVSHYYHTCAMLAAGSAQCWGYNVYGQLGDGTTDHSSTPVDVTGLPSLITQISTGSMHTCALLETSGVVCWGINSLGELGDGTLVSSHTPVQVICN